MEQRSERVLIETPRHRIAGTVTLAGTYRSRVSDLLNSPDRNFIALTDVTIEVLDSEVGGTHHDFIAVSRRHIVFALPLGESTMAVDASLS
jgi:hypothetical protein